jgi:hypothetical protein
MAEEAPKKRKVGPSLEDLVSDSAAAAPTLPSRVAIGPVVGPRPPGAAAVAAESGEDAAARRREAEAREWELVRRGQAEKTGAAGGGREAWMTQLPEGSRQDALQFFRGGKTSFSSKGAQGPESAAEWGLAPGQQLTLEQEDKRAREAAARKLAEEQAGAVQRQVDAFNAQSRPKSLLELHQQGAGDEEEQEESKRKKKMKKDKKKKDKKKKERKKEKKKTVVTATLGAREVGTWDRDASMKSSLSTEQKVARLSGTERLTGRFAAGL